MRGQRITDGTNLDPLTLRSREASDGGALSFDLADVLDVLGWRAIESIWRVADVESVDHEVGEFGSLAAAAESMSGARLLELARATQQVIDGQFSAFAVGSNAPWVVVKAVDSTFWEVWTDDEPTRAAVRARFKDVADLRADAA